jgi:YidC/Oxa1 family membrane protein insertase
MEKRTILAVALSMAVMIGFFAIQDLINPPQPAPPPSRTTAPAPTPTRPVIPLEEQLNFPETLGEIIPLQNVIVETELIRVVLTNAGGNIVSFQLKKHLDRGAPVEMIFAGDTAPTAFAIAFGNQEDVLSRRIQPVGRNFRVRRVSNLIVEFSQDFSNPGGGFFTLLKRYEFLPNEYLFELTVSMTSNSLGSSFNFQGAAYTLIFGPQIGPRFEKLEQRYEYRHYFTYRGRLRNERVNEREPTIISNQPNWAAIAGKYFTIIALPYLSQFELAFSAQAEQGLPSASRFFITRPTSSGSRIEDKYQFYIGPKNQENLNIYERGDNAFRLRDTGLIEVANTRGFLAPLENILKWLLQLFHRIIPNYGIAIILLTVLVKIVLFPLTRKSSESIMRMQALAPKIKEIQEKHKGNSQKMNAEMSEFYKKEGYNPLSGCLPMVIQIPIFFAMYNLFNNHFDLRGAEFIPVWIPDLSVPESIYDFPNNFALPLLGWTAIRLLPFIYVGSQLLYGKVTQTPNQQANAQMKLMLYVLPIVFFFILYDVPSGLLLYWIMSNILTMVQQLGINKYLARKNEMAGTPEPTPAITPGRPKKKKKE